MIPSFTLDIIALMLVRPRKWLKQIIQIKDNRVKNPTWAEANQMAIHKRDRGSEIWTTMNNSSPNNKTRNLESEQGNYRHFCHSSVHS